MRLLLSAQRVSDGVWTSVLDSAELELFGKPMTTRGPVSVVLLHVDPPTVAGELVVETKEATLLNRGTGSTGVFVTSQDPAASQPRPVDDGPGAGTSEELGGDREFLRMLPPVLREVGTAFLRDVRRRWPGELRFSAPSGRFVETPDNFWTVKIQPRDASLRVTVRGEASKFPPLPALELKDDRNGYSTFKVRTVRDLGPAMSVLERSRRR